MGEYYIGNQENSKAYIVSNEIGLYEKYGFSKIVDKNDVCGNDDQIFAIDI